MTRIDKGLAKHWTWLNRIETDWKGLKRIEKDDKDWQSIEHDGNGLKKDKKGLKRIEKESWSSQVLDEYPPSPGAHGGSCVAWLASGVGHLGLCWRMPVGGSWSPSGPSATTSSAWSFEPEGAVGFDSGHQQAQPDWRRAVGSFVCLAIHGGCPPSSPTGAPSPLQGAAAQASVAWVAPSRVSGRRGQKPWPHAWHTAWWWAPSSRAVASACACQPRARVLSRGKLPLLWPSSGSGLGQLDDHEASHRCPPCWLVAGRCARCLVALTTPHPLPGMRAQCVATTWGPPHMPAGSQGCGGWLSSAYGHGPFAAPFLDCHSRGPNGHTPSHPGCRPAQLEPGPHSGLGGSCPQQWWQSVAGIAHAPKVCALRTGARRTTTPKGCCRLHPRSVASVAGRRAAVLVGFPLHPPRQPEPCPFHRAASSLGLEPGPGRLWQKGLCCLAVDRLVRPHCGHCCCFAGSASWPATSKCTIHQWPPSCARHCAWVGLTVPPCFPQGDCPWAIRPSHFAPERSLRCGE